MLIEGSIRVSQMGRLLYRLCALEPPVSRLHWRMVFSITVSAVLSAPSCTDTTRKPFMGRCGRFGYRSSTSWATAASTLIVRRSGRSGLWATLSPSSRRRAGRTIVSGRSSPRPVSSGRTSSGAEIPVSTGSGMGSSSGGFSLGNPP